MVPGHRPLPLTAERMAAHLTAAGIDVDLADVELRERDGRSYAVLPGGRMAWFAASPEGLALMATERRVLRILEARCRFPAPRVLHEAPGGDFDVRAMVPGRHDTDRVAARLRGDGDAARFVGRALGMVLAELHTRVLGREVRGWLPARPGWPESRASIRERLPRVVHDHALHAAADRVMEHFEDCSSAVPDSDRVLTHTDLGLHNASIDPESLEMHGVFDWESACWSDRHVDFRYLLIDQTDTMLLDSAIAAYEPAAGVAISRDRVFLYNAACAVGYLAYRDGIAPETRWCGRTLEEDLAWTRAAIARIA